MTLTSTTTPGQSEPGNDGNERVLHILLCSRTGISLSDRLVLNPGLLLEMQLVYSTAPVDWAR